jgi:hypothetical protein
MLKQRVDEELKLLGLNSFEKPIFYNAYIGIRFKIGVGEVYNRKNRKLIPRKEYISNALNRVNQVYNMGIKSPEIMVWETYHENGEDKNTYRSLFKEKIINVMPSEEVTQDINCDGEIVKQTLFYWDLKNNNIPIEKVFREIILGDVGGSNEFVSSVFLFDVKNHVMLYLYDDRGLDIVSHDKNALMGIYKQLNTWILDYDREKIDKVFLRSEEL